MDSSWLQLLSWKELCNPEWLPYGMATFLKWSLFNFGSLKFALCTDTEKAFFMLHWILLIGITPNFCGYQMLMIQRVISSHTISRCYHLAQPALHLFCLQSLISIWESLTPPLLKILRGVFTLTTSSLIVTLKRKSLSTTINHVLCKIKIYDCGLQTVIIFQTLVAVEGYNDSYSSQHWT